MPEQPVITDEMRSIIGVESEPISEVVERGAIRRFAEAIEDTNPLYVDEVYARKTRYGGIIAPPTFLCSIGHLRKSGRSGGDLFDFKRPYPNGRNAGTEWEFFEPVRLGDTITMTASIVDFYEKQGREKPLLFTVSELTFRNQLGQMVAKLRSIGVSFPD
ncbi:MAG: MaoC family dehydratase N-terminal domain-containing protein [Chloroflexi bacterium]|nr:MaoC family dehydratase N-terminal domain-containing protein [Chloroflexota bacterium]MCL5025105.1 MaoC family dehydratase N-terminal domain-containing protein [Chloroflexota bacterium]